MEAWTGFFATITGVAAALLTIAFLTFQLKATWWSHALRRYIAIFTLLEFGAPIIIGLIVLMPRHPWRIASIIVGITGLALLIAYWVGYAQTRTALKVVGKKPDRFDRDQILLSPITLACSIILVASGFITERVGVYMVASVSIWLLISGSVESWRFLAPDSVTDIDASSAPTTTDTIQAEQLDGKGEAQAGSRGSS
jgi:hypothetical protein